MVPKLWAETSTISCHSAAREGRPFISGQEDHGEVCFVQMCSLQKPNPSADLEGADQTTGAGTGTGARAAGRPARPPRVNLLGERAAFAEISTLPAGGRVRQQLQPAAEQTAAWHGMIIKYIFLIRHSAAAGARAKARTAPASAGSEHSTGGLPGGIKSHLALQRRKALPPNCHAGSPADWFHNTSSSDNVCASGCISEHSPRPPELPGAVIRFRNKNLFGEIFTTISFYESQS